jgi:hypothetical protein
MADFCTKCAPEMGFDADINIEAIAAKLKPGTYQPCLCEGCVLMAIGKTDEGVTILAVPDGAYHQESEEQQVRWVSQEEFMALPSKI